MNSRLKLRLFVHSWRSDWNHGNAHFLRGLAYELEKAGHEVRCYEPENSWSLTHLLEEGARGRQALDQFRSAFQLDVRTYSPANFAAFAERELADADVVVVHEWNSPEIIATILQLKQKFNFAALFHDTHHRAYTKPEEISLLQIDRFDGVLAFGEIIRQIYLENFKAKRAWTFHEAADTAHFFPFSSEHMDDEVNWVGNWGDEERTRELTEFLVEPLGALKRCRSAVYGVRYPASAQERLQQAGIEYRGYLPNLSAPGVYSRSLLTLHIPRRCYANGLSGVPTIRMFEAMACGIPLICSPWTDTEGLFRVNQDYICVPDGRAMLSELQHLLKDDKARQELAASALETIQRHHTCAHRAEQFRHICEELAR